ncbi:MAG TPA: hypothetical protein VL175_21425 [Pirellulales bacterium]|nr:hypothetical protein [Pirellulales bacterium]
MPRYSVSIATVITLVALRLVIGWHFFSEGMKHYASPRWTSEPVLRSAKGPMAPWYHAYLSDFHGYREWMEADTQETPDQAVQGWIGQIQNDWEAYRQRFASHYQLSEAGQKRSQAILREYQDKLRNWTAGNQAALATHVHEWRRRDSKVDAPDSELPFQKKRLADKHASLTAESSGWQAELKRLEREYQEELGELTDGPAMPHETDKLAMVDATMTYGILTIGLLLLLGLFTPVACGLGALFLASVVMMQPFWISDAAPTFKETVELVALVALGTTPVGRWAGLDYFVAKFFTRAGGSKGKSDVLES